MPSTLADEPKRSHEAHRPQSRADHNEWRISSQETDTFDQGFGMTDHFVAGEASRGAGSQSHPAGLTASGARIIGVLRRNMR
jgi:hypothetical protein